MWCCTKMCAYKCCLERFCNSENGTYFLLYRISMRSGLPDILLILAQGHQVPQEFQAPDFLMLQGTKINKLKLDLYLPVHVDNCTPVYAL